MFRRCILLACLLSAPALADYRAGVRAWGRGDFATAAREFLPAAQSGDAEAQFMVGRLYSLGDGLPQDWPQAWAWFDRAARQGHAEAGQARDQLQAILTPPQLVAAQVAAAPPPLAPPVVAAVPPPDDRQVVLVPRRGVVVGGPAASLTAPGATEEGRLRALGRVDAVQFALNRAGYDAGPVDGVLGPRTRQAIRAWQQDHGEAASGQVTARLLAGLNAAEEAQQAAR